MEYYDQILTGMFCSIAAGAIVGAFTHVPLNMAAGMGALTAAGFMYHGMFQRAPVV